LGIFSIYFIKNGKGFIHLRHKICPKEIDIQSQFPIFTSGFVQPTFAPLFAVTSVNGTKYTLSSTTNVDCHNIPLEGNSLCQKLVYLDYYARCNNLQDNFISFIQLLNKCIKFRNKEKCKTITPIKISKSVLKTVKYLNYANIIFKKYLLPLIVDMCYTKCLCSDLGFSCKAQTNLTENQQLEKTLMLLSYQTIKTIEKINDDYYKNLNNLISAIEKAKAQQYGFKETTKCGEIEKKFNTILQNFYNDWNTVKITVDEVNQISLDEKEFSNFAKVEDFAKMKEYYDKFIEGISRIKKALDKVRALSDQLEQFITANIEKEICVSYLIGTLFERFDNPKGTLEKLMNLSIVSIFQKLPETKQEKFRIYNIYFILKNKHNFEPKLYFPPLEKAEDTVKNGVVLITRLFDPSSPFILDGIDLGQQNRWSPYLIPLFDYHLLFFNTAYKFAKCGEGKNLLEYAEKNEKRAALLDCFFTKHDFKMCLEEHYLNIKIEMKKVWDEFFSLTKIENLNASKVKEIMSKIKETIGEKDKTYPEIFPLVKNACTNICCKCCIGITQEDIDAFTQLCPGNSLPNCPVAGQQCVLCYDTTQKKIVPSNRQCPTYQLASTILSRLTPILFKELENNQANYCKRGKEILNGCKGTSAQQCSFGESICSGDFRFNAAFQNLKNISKDYPEISKDDLEKVVPDSKISCEK
jgi:hypothetical protein